MVSIKCIATLAIVALMAIILPSSILAMPATANKCPQLACFAPQPWCVTFLDGSKKTFGDPCQAENYLCQNAITPKSQKVGAC